MSNVKEQESSSSKTELSKEQIDKIEKNRQKALSIRMKKSPNKNKILTVETLKKNLISIDGEKFIDSSGGFLIEETKKIEEKVIDNSQFQLLDSEPVVCKECGHEFFESYLQKTFDYPVCDLCRDNDDKHSLITKTDAKAEYLLKDCDFDKREPPLKFISRKNPHNSRWGDMKLYLLPQVEKRAIEVYGSFEKIEEAHQSRSEKKIVQKTKKYNKNLKALRMAVRSSLFDRTTGPTHQHDFNPEIYNEEEDTYSKSCKTCSFVETYEKM